MKTISMEFTEYKKDLKEAEEVGHNVCVRAVSNFFRTLFVKIDKEDAWHMAHEIFGKEAGSICMHLGLEEPK